MEKLFLFLNNTSGERLFWYGLFILILLNIIFKFISSLYKTYKKYKNEINNG